MAALRIATMVELRKRPAREEPPPTLKKASSKKAKKEEASAPQPAPEPAPVPAAVEEETIKSPVASTGPPGVGDHIILQGFGGEVETNDGTKVTLAKLVEDSKAGVVLFTYPKASTPGCKHHALDLLTPALIV